jgi:hypothetical protein
MVRIRRDYRLSTGKSICIALMGDNVSFLEGYGEDKRQYIKDNATECGW